MTSGNDRATPSLERRHPFNGCRRLWAQPQSHTGEPFSRQSRTMYRGTYRDAFCDAHPLGMMEVAGAKPGRARPAKKMPAPCSGRRAQTGCAGWGGPEAGAAYGLAGFPPVSLYTACKSWAPTRDSIFLWVGSMAFLNASRSASVGV